MQWKTTKEKNMPRQKELFPNVTSEEEMILNAIKAHDEIHINALTTSLNLPVYQILSTLVELEFKGLVHSLPGCRYALA